MHGLSDDGVRVFAILRLLHEWIPAPRAGRLASEPGFTPPRARYVSCPDCLANDRVLPGCSTCGGRGEVFVGGRDPMSEPVAVEPDARRAAPGFGGGARELEHDDRRRLVELERRLIDEADVRAGRTAPADAQTRALDARDRLYARGSVEDVAIALERLRDLREDDWRRCYGIALDPPGLDAPLSRPLVVAVERLTALVPKPVRVPAGAVVDRDAEVERIARAAGSALWRGRNPWAARTRSERDRLVVALVLDAGLAPGVVAWRVGLSRRRVQQIVAAAAAPGGGGGVASVSGVSRARCGP